MMFESFFVYQQGCVELQFPGSNDASPCAAQGCVKQSNGRTASALLISSVLKKPKKKPTYIKVDCSGDFFQPPDPIN